MLLLLLLHSLHVEESLVVAAVVPVASARGSPPSRGRVGLALGGLDFPGDVVGTTAELVVSSGVRGAAALQLLVQGGGAGRTLLLHQLGYDGFHSFGSLDEKKQVLISKHSPSESENKIKRTEISSSLLRSGSSSLKTRREKKEKKRF